MLAVHGRETDITSVMIQGSWAAKLRIAGISGRESVAGGRPEEVAPLPSVCDFGE